VKKTLGRVHLSRKHIAEDSSTVPEVGGEEKRFRLFWNSLGVNNSLQESRGDKPDRL